MCFNGAMTSWGRNLALMAAGVFIAQAGFSIVTPFLPALVAETRVSGAVGSWSGILFALNFLTYSLMAPVWGSLSDRVGHRPMMVRAGVGAAVTSALLVFATDIWELAVLRAVNGLVSGYIPAAQALAARHAPEEGLGRSLGVLQAASAAGLVSGPLLGGLAAEAVGVRGALGLAAGLLVMAGLLPLALRLPEVGLSAGDLAVGLGRSVVQDVRRCLQDPYLRRLLRVQLVFTAAQLAVQPTLPLYVARLVPARPMLATGILYGIVGVATAVGAPLASRVPEAAATAALRAALATAALVSCAHGLWGHVGYLAGVRFAFGLTTAAATVLLGVLVARQVPPSQRGRAFGVMQAVTGIGSAAGPLAGGWVGDRLGLEASFWAMGLAFAASWALSPRVGAPAAAVSRRLPAP